MYDRWDNCLPTPDVIPTGSTVPVLSGQILGPHKRHTLVELLEKSRSSLKTLPVALSEPTLHDEAGLVAASGDWCEVGLGGHGQVVQ